MKRQLLRRTWRCKIIYFFVVRRLWKFENFQNSLADKVNTFMLLFKRLLLPFAWSMAITEIELHINLFFFPPLTHHPWTAQSHIVCCVWPFYSRHKHRWDGTMVTGHTLSQLWCWLPYWPLEDSEYWERNWNFLKMIHFPTQRHSIMEASEMNWEIARIGRNGNVLAVHVNKLVLSVIPSKKYIDFVRLIQVRKWMFPGSSFKVC